MSRLDTSAYCCDFCEKESDPSQLRRLRSDSVKAGRGVKVRTASADICQVCQLALPVSALIERLDRRIAERTQAERKDHVV